MLLYEMLVGASPFSGCDEDMLFWSICNEIPWYPFYLSNEATDILTKVRLNCSHTRAAPLNWPQSNFVSIDSNEQLMDPFYFHFR